MLTKEFLNSIPWKCIYYGAKKLADLGFMLKDESLLTKTYINDSKVEVTYVKAFNAPYEFANIKYNNYEYYYINNSGWIAEDENGKEVIIK